jgi:glycolate oxidase FAD binding subunit
VTVAAQATVRSDLAALLGEGQVRSDEASRLAGMVDGMLPQFAVIPTAAEQVAALLRYASEHQLAVIPLGYGTKLTTGAPPRQYDIALSLSGMQRVLHYEPADLTIGVQAGVSFQDFQNLVGKNNLWLPLDPRGAGNSSIGGIIASNAAGPLRQGYGGPRDMVIGLTVATTDGKITKSGGKVVKNVAGYDLGKLFTGSAGTLGVIVEANLKLFTRQPTRATFAFKAGSIEIASAVRRKILRSPLDPMRLLLLDAQARNLLSGSTPGSTKPPFELWIELGGSHRVIERCMLELRHLAAESETSLERKEDAESDWEKIADLARWLQPQYNDVTVLKAALPIAGSEQFIRRSQQAAAAAKIPLASFAQVGIGIAHLGIPQEHASEAMAEFVTQVRQAARDLRGMLVVEHAPLDLKRKVDVWGAISDDLPAMRKLKTLWDPHAVLSPGRFVDGI